MTERRDGQTETASSAPRRRRFRFGLRSALTLLTLVAVASWVYWHGWPRYVVYRAQREFEEQVKHELQPGELVHDVRAVGGLEHTLVGYGSDSTGKGVAYACRVWPNKIYVIYGPNDGSSMQEWVHFRGVEVFPLEGLPAGYSPQTERGRDVWQRYQTGHFGTKELQAYLSDFLEVLKGDRVDNLGFQYVLIHEVPAAAPTLGGGGAG